MNKFCPKARKDKIITTKVGDEAIVFDTETGKASCLNGITTVVWEACDGNSGIESLLDTVRNAGYQDATDQLIWMAIDQLNEAGLIETVVDFDVKSRNIYNRREMLRLFGVSAATVLPVVSSINIKPAIAQVSCAAKHESCASIPCCIGPCHTIAGARICQH